MKNRSIKLIILCLTLFMFFFRLSFNYYDKIKIKPCNPLEVQQITSKEANSYIYNFTNRKHIPIFNVKGYLLLNIYNIVLLMFFAFIYKQLYIKELFIDFRYRIRKLFNRRFEGSIYKMEFLFS